MGLALIGWSGYKIGQAKQEDEPVLPIVPLTEPDVKTPNADLLFEVDQRILNHAFGDHFAEHNLEAIGWEKLPNGTFNLRQNKNEETFFIVIQTPDAVLMCTHKLTEAEVRQVADVLKRGGYTRDRQLQRRTGNRCRLRYAGYAAGAKTAVRRRGTR